MTYSGILKLTAKQIFHSTIFRIFGLVKFKHAMINRLLLKMLVLQNDLTPNFVNRQNNLQYQLILFPHLTLQEDITTITSSLFLVSCTYAPQQKKTIYIRIIQPKAMVQKESENYITPQVENSKPTKGSIVYWDFIYNLLLPKSRLWGFSFFGLGVMQCVLD